MIFDFLIFGLAMYLTIPFAVGYFAKCYGLKFWPWFWFGCFLPGISHVVLYFKVSSRKGKNGLSRYEDSRMGFLIDKEMERPAPVRDNEKNTIQ